MYPLRSSAVASDGNTKIRWQISVIKRNNSSREDNNVRFYLLHLFFVNDCTFRGEKSHKDCYSVPSPSSDFSRIPSPQACVSQAHCRSPHTHLFFFTPFPLPHLEMFPKGFIPRFVQTILPFLGLPGACAELERVHLTTSGEHDQTRSRNSGKGTKTCKRGDHKTTNKATDTPPHTPSW